MILVVDDESAVVQILVRSLRREGYEVSGHTSAVEALKEATSLEPELIISDIAMPEMDGHQFRATYARQFPDRKTPFVFLSALSDPDNVIRGLDEGADDYLTKPIKPPVFVARVKAILRRVGASPPATFRGQIGELTFVQLLQFCERRGMTGDVRITAADVELTLWFDAGELVIEGTDVEDKLARLMDLAEGDFVVVSRPVDFEEIAESQRVPELPKLETAEPLPMGKLSGLKLGDQLLQIQTEYERSPIARIVTLVVLEGRVMHQREAPPPAGASTTELGRLIEEQHVAVEQSIQQRAEALIKKRAQPASEPAATRETYLERGLELYRAGNLEGALQTLTQGVAAFPHDRLLQANLKIVASKMSNV